jgi:predicted esterase
MTLKTLLLYVFIGISFKLFPQNLEVPDSIKNELKEKIFYNNKSTLDTIAFKIVYPTNYDSTKTYPVFLCFSGGNQSESIVNYCYAVWFRSHYFKNYITILPVNRKKKNLKNYFPTEIEQTIKTIQSNFRVTSSNWIIAGTSNGGAAAYNFVSENPTLYKALIVIPGSIGKTIEVNKKWKHLTCILAYGDKDDQEWISASREAKLVLDGKVKKVCLVVLEGQEHILPLGFNINLVYDSYFKK